MTPYPTCRHCHLRVAAGQTVCYFCEYMGRKDWGDDPAPAPAPVKVKRQRTEHEREYNRRYWEAHRAEGRERSRRYYQRHKPEVLARIAQRRAEQRGQA